jgi:hypothetical protein
MPRNETQASRAEVVEKPPLDEEDRTGELIAAIVRASAFDNQVER